MAMTLIKKADGYKIYKRGDGRFAVQNASGKPVNGEEKVNVLLAEELIKVTLPSPAAAAPEVDAEAEAEAEAPAEEAAAEEEAAEEEAAAE